MEVKRPNSLTARRERFAREYLLDLNATQAGIRAGYSAKTANEQGSRLLANVSVKARIAELQEAAAKRNELKVDDVVGMLLDSYKEAKAANQHGPAVRAAELLGKKFGMFKDRVEVSEVQAMTDEKLAARLAKQGGGGDPALQRRIFRNTLEAMGNTSFEPRPEMSDDEIDRLLEGVDTLH